MIGRRTWRNARVKAGALLAALLATAGFYGLIQAQQPAHAVPPPATQTATPAQTLTPTPEPTPLRSPRLVVPGQGTGSSVGAGSAQNTDPAPRQTPVRRVTRTRAS